MNRVAAKYLEVIGELRLARFERELLGEELPQDVEVEFVAELDRLWHQLSDDEQDTIEANLAAGAALAAPAVLPLVDADSAAGRGPRGRAA